MKKILLALLTLISISCFSQTTGYLRYDSVKIMKQNGNSNLIIENATRDSLGFLYNYGGGRTRFEVIRSVPGGIKVGEDTIQVAVNGPDEFIVIPTVSWKGTGYQFAIQEGVYRIDNVIYTSDSGSITLAASDPTDPRKDVIYVGTDGAFHVLQGTPAPAADEPQLNGDQLKVTVIDVPAGSTVPSLTQEVIYNENIEWGETHTSVTVDPNSTGNAWIGTKATNITNINHGDVITWTRPIGFVSVLNYQAISFAIDLKAILATTTNLRVSFFSSGIQVSNEVNINLNKNSLVYQANTIPMSQFTFSNYNINAVRVRYTNSAGATVHTGFYMDYIHLVAGFSQPGGGGDFNYTLVMPSGFAVSPATVSNNGTHTVTGSGSTSQYIDGTGALRTFTAWNTQGAIDGVAKTAFGYGISGNIFYQQYADATYPGLLSALNWRRFDTAALRAVTNGATGDTLAAFVDNYTTLIKSLKDSTGIGIIDRGDYLAIYATGGGGGGFFTSSAATGTTIQDAGSENFTFKGTGVATVEFIMDDAAGNVFGLRFIDPQNLRVGGNWTGFGGETYTNYGAGGAIIQHSDNLEYQFYDLPDSSVAGTHYMVAWNATDDRLYKMALPTGGGGVGSGLFPTTGTGTATGAVIGALAGNNLSITGADTINYSANLHQWAGDFKSASGITWDLNALGLIFHDVVANTVRFNLEPQNGIIETVTLSNVGDGNEGRITSETLIDGSEANFLLRADYQDGENTATILGRAISSGATITYTADTHTFNGSVISNNNVLIGGTSIATSATTTLHLFNGTAPSASITDGVLLYAQDNSSSSELKVRDEAGNVTTLSPHNFSGIGQKSEEMAWAFYSEKDGTYINVDMLKLVRLVEKLTGEKLVFIGKK